MKVKTNFGATGISRYFFKRAIKYGSIGNTHAAAVPQKRTKERYRFIRWKNQQQML